MKKLSKFGVAVRKMRLDRGMTLTDFADRLGVSPTYVSSVEFGRKPITENYLAATVRELCSNRQQEIELNDAADRSRDQLVIDARHLSEDAKLAAAGFARRIADLDSETVQLIKSLVKHDDMDR